MQTNISADTSRRITSLRFLLMVLVVFIHNNFTAQSIAESVANGGFDIIFRPNALSRWTQLLISDGIARCAVPLFFLFAAYLQAKKADSYGVLLKKRARSLLVPFVLWTALYVFYYGGVKLIVAKIAPQFVHHPETSWLTWTPADWFHNILGYELKDGDISLPRFAIQFWFLRDLMLLVIASPLIIRLIRRFPVGFFAITVILFIIPVRHLYVVKVQAVFFYVAGLYWGLYDLPLLEKIDRVSWAESIALFAATFFATWRFYGHNTTMYWCMVLCACELTLKFSRVIAAHEKSFVVASYLAGFSFFLYAVHTPVLEDSLLKRLWLHFFPMKNAFFCLFEYFGVSVLTIAIGTAAGIALKKICPPLFRLLNGGR